MVRVAAPQDDAERARHDATRRERTRWIGVGLALVFLLLSAGQKAYRMTLPIDGWTATVAPDNYTVERNALGRPSPLRPGDEVLAVGGEDIRDWRRRALRGQLTRPAAGWRAGATIRYTVRRAGRLRVLAVPLYHWDLRLLDATSLQQALEVVPLLLLTLVVFLKRPDSRAAQLLLAYGVAGSMILITYFDDLAPGPGLETAFAPAPLFWLAREISQAIFSDLNLLTLYLALTFPVRRGPARTHPRLLIAVLVLLGVSWDPAYLLHADALITFEGVVLLALLLVQLGVALYNAVTLRDPVVRAQARWVGLAYVYSTAAFFVTFLGFFGVLPRAWSAWPPLSMSAFVFAAVLAVAILRYRLFAIDVILNRALVYGTLTVFVVGAYVAIVSYLGAALPAHSGLGRGPLPPLVATGVVAVLFQPVRAWAQRRVNRLLYGARDEPYAVLAQLGQRLEGAVGGEALLPAIAETVGRALKLPSVAILLEQDGALSLAAEYRAASAAPAGHGHAATTAPADVALPLVAQGKTVGELRLALRPGESDLGPADHRLLGDLARQAGIAAQAARLTADLRGLTVTLQHAREQLVTTREEERRRLRRDLHDGLGPALASVTFKVEAARNLLHRDPARADTLLASVAEQTQGTIADIRRLVYELAPPALDQLGLVAALRQYAAQLDGGPHGTQVGVEAPAALPTLPAAVEVAAYRIALEATTNALRHAAARRCTIHLALEDGNGTGNADSGAGIGDEDGGAALVVTVEDDGRGVPKRPHAGVGLAAMRERAAELGGGCVIAPRLGGGTTVRARLPLGAGHAAGRGPRVPTGAGRDGEGEP